VERPADVKPYGHNHNNDVGRFNEEIPVSDIDKFLGEVGYMNSVAIWSVIIFTFIVGYVCGGARLLG
jgi:hypothetical protein